MAELRWEKSCGFEMEAISARIEYCLSGEKSDAYLNLYGSNYRHK